jgi:hypothetical protein
MLRTHCGRGRPRSKFVKILKRILIILLAVLLAVQVPFIYRRWKIGQIADKIANAPRTTYSDPNFKEYKGIIHAHTSLGGHSTGGFDELIAAANSNDLDFVLMTEHYSDSYDTSALTLNGVYGKTLFVGGNEIDTADGDRFLMIPGSADAASLRNMPTNAVIEKLHNENRLALITYPEKFKSWDSQFDGDEVFSIHTAAQKANPFTALFDLIWSYPAYPKLTLASYFRRPDENLAKFDEIAAKRKISLVAGTDAHSNIGFHLFGDDAGNKLINIKIDPYATTFGIMRLHVLIDKDKPFDRDSLIEAIKAGRCFVGFDAMGDTSNFVFRDEDHVDEDYVVVISSDIDRENGAKRISHDNDPGGVDLTAIAPIRARFVMFRNGEKLTEVSGTVALSNIHVTERGAYRVEVYRDDLGPPFDQMPWIISNPIYVR